MDSVPRTHQYYQSAKTACISSLRLIVSPATTTKVCSFTYTACALLISHRQPIRPGWILVSVSPVTDTYAQWKIQALPGFLAVHPATLRRSSDPGRFPNTSPFSGVRNTAPILTTMKAPANMFISGLNRTLHRLLCTLHDSRYRLPCNTRFRPAG